MQIEAKQYVKILKATQKLAEALGYGKKIDVLSWGSTPQGGLGFKFAEKESDEELIFTFPKPKE